MFVRITTDRRPRPNSLGDLGLTSGSNPIVSLNEFTYKKGAEIYGEKEPAEYVYQVKTGAVRSYKLLNEEYTKLVTTGKVEAGGPIGQYAYGFSDKKFGGKHIVGQNGGSAGIAANFEMYPELGYTSVILMNVDPPAMMPVIMGIRQRIPTQ
jgi:hypothetical protein